jgi:hypothetical protein
MCAGTRQLSAVLKKRIRGTGEKKITLCRFVLNLKSRKGLFYTVPGVPAQANHWRVGRLPCQLITTGIVKKI